MLDHTGLGVVQLDAGGRIVAANDRARDVLQDRRRPSWTATGILFAVHTTRTTTICRRCSSRALPSLGAQGTGGSTIVRRPGAQPPLVLHVSPVVRREAEFPVGQVAAVVLVVDPAGRAAIDPAVVAAVLDLTGMESRIAVLLAQGMSVRQIATATGRKESTIRSHVKHMFAKHGLSRQAQLVQLVRSLAGAPEADG